MKKILLFLSYGFCFHPSLGQRHWEKIDAFVEQEMHQYNIPNVSLIVVNKDSILYQKEYGKDKSPGNYLIGSISKSFTALAVMQLQEKGALAMDTPVKQDLPWFELSKKDLSNKITVRHLLNQTTGIPKKAGFFTPQGQQQTEIEQEYTTYLQSLTIYESAIGKTHIYCNLNYQILGQLIQKVSGLSYGDYVRKYIFAPVGMENSFATYEETQQAGLKNGYQYLFGFPLIRSFAYNNNGLAAGDISSNAADMGKFLRVLLNKGTTPNDTIIGQALLEQMQTPFSNRYGMGFSIGDWNGLHSVRHTGLSKNYSSAINILPEQNHGIAVLTNINSFYASRQLMDGVIRRLHRQEEIPYPPYEVYFRYLILGIIIWSMVSLGVKIKRWRSQNFQAKFSGKFKLIFSFVLNVLFALVWLVIIPRLADIPLAKMPSLQPDLGYGLLVGAILGIGSAIVQYFIKSNTALIPITQNEPRWPGLEPSGTPSS